MLVFFQAEDGIRDYKVTGVQSFFSSRRRHTRLQGDWSSDVCSSDLHSRAVFSREKHDRRVIEKLELVADPLFEFIPILAGLALYLVPLFDADDERAPALVGITGDGGVQRDDAFGSVQHEEDDVGHADVAARHDDAHLLRHVAGFSLAADARRVDEDILRTLVDHGLVHRIAGSAGHGRHNGPLFAGEGVEQGRFAHVRAADDGHLDTRRGGRILHRRLAARKPSGHAVEQGIHADAMLRRDREYVRNAKSKEFVRQAVADLRIDLVDGEGDRFTQALEHLGEVAVAAGDFGAPVHQEDDVIGGLQDEFGLAEDLPRNVLLVVHDDAAGIDHFEAPAVVFGSPMYAVACDAGFVPDDGAPLSCDAVEKSGLSYVGPAHDDYRGEIGHDPL